MAVGGAGEQGVGFRVRDAERINKAVLAYESGRRPANGSKLPRATGGGGGGMTLGRLTQAWQKNTLADVVAYDSGEPLQEVASDPPSVLAGCVNKLADGPGGRLVYLGLVNGVYHLISWEC